jgi:hypothetical protein
MQLGKLSQSKRNYYWIFRPIKDKILSHSDMMHHGMKKIKLLQKYTFSYPVKKQDRVERIYILM